MRPRKWNTQSSLGFWNTNRSLNLGQSTRPSDRQKKKKNWRVDFALPADHRVKFKENEEREIYKYLDLARKLKKEKKNPKTMNMKMTVIYQL